MGTNKNIGLGTSAIGRPLYINIRQESRDIFSLPKFRESGLQMLEGAYGEGIRFFDTAPGYGLAEELLEEWVKEKNDPNIIVSSKWGYSYVADFKANPEKHEAKEHSIIKLKEQWSFSRKLLPYLKIYQIHSATFDTGVLTNNEVLQLLNSIKKKHNIVIGITTTGVNQVDVLREALQITIEGETLFESVQCTFNILDQNILSLRDELTKTGTGLIIKEALANGRLIPNEKFAQYRVLYNHLRSLAKKYRVGVDAIALRYCMECFPEAVVLSGADNCIHLIANLKAGEFSLNDIEMEQLHSYRITSQKYWKERAQLTWA